MKVTLAVRLSTAGDARRNLLVSELIHQNLIVADQGVQWQKWWDNDTSLKGLLGWSWWDSNDVCQHDYQLPSRQGCKANLSDKENLNNGIWKRMFYILPCSRSYSLSNHRLHACGIKHANNRKGGLIIEKSVFVHWL